MKWISLKYRSMQVSSFVKQVIFRRVQWVFCGDPEEMGGVDEISVNYYKTGIPVPKVGEHLFLDDKRFEDERFEILDVTHFPTCFRPGIVIDLKKETYEQ